jgi:hypothetical protein
MKSLTALSIAACAVLGTGCAGSVETTEPEAQASDDALIAKYLQRQWGFEPSTIRIKGDRVIADGDGLFSKAELLDEIESTGFSLAPTQMPQGYWYGNGTASPAWAASDGTFSFSASVPEAWRAAFRPAFGRWSAASGSDCVTFHEAGAGVYGINITVADCGIADDGFPAEACSGYPKWLTQKGVSHFRLGQIQIDDGSVGEPSSDWRIHTAMHEIGHALGFSHPWQGYRISGTATNTAGCCSASYYTVMDYYGDTTLSSDDLLSLSKKFSKTPNPPHASFCGG